MFLFTEAGYQLFRNRGRTVLLACVSLLLCGCIVFYLGNISSNEKALATLSESTPAVARVSNVFANEFDNLTISYTVTDGLVNRGMSKVLATSQASGYLSEESREEMARMIEERQRAFESGEAMGFSFSTAIGFTYMEIPAGDTAILGISCLDVLGDRLEGRFTFEEGYDGSLLEGDEALCLVRESVAQANGLTLGDKVSMEMCFVQYSSQGMVVRNLISQPEWEIVGIYPDDLKTDRPADMYIPIKWLRAEVEANAPGIPFTYTSFAGYLADGMKLNEFKESITDMGLNQPFFIPDDRERFPDRTAGRVLFMEDEDFIKTAEKLGENIRQYRIFMGPFFVVVVLLVTLSIFLVLRGSQRDMAVACSLGRPKLLTGAASLLAALAAELIGSLVAMPVMVLAVGLSLGTALQVGGAFMLCALLGDIIGLAALLRFDALSLLIVSE